MSLPSRIITKSDVKNLFLKIKKCPKKTNSDFPKYLKIERRIVSLVYNKNYSARQVDWIFCVYYLTMICHKNRFIKTWRRTKEKRSGIYKGTSRNALQWFDKIDHKIMKTLGIKRQQLRKVIEFLRKEGFVKEGKDRFTGNPQVTFEMPEPKDKWTQGYVKIDIESCFKKKTTKIKILEALQKDLYKNKKIKNIFKSDSTLRRHKKKISNYSSQKIDSVTHFLEKKINNPTEIKKNCRDIKLFGKKFNGGFKKIDWWKAKRGFIRTSRTSEEVLFCCGDIFVRNLGEWCDFKKKLKDVSRYN